MPRLTIQTNMPVEARLLALAGETAPSNFGSDQIRFRTDKGDLYVSEAVGAILQEAILRQNVQLGEPCEIAKRETALGNGRKGIRWELTRTGFAPGEQPNGTFAVPAPPAPPAPPAKPPAAAAIGTYQPRERWTEVLLAQTNALTDVLAEALRHSSQHGGAVKAEDVRSLLVTCFINLSKGISNRAA